MPIQPNEVNELAELARIKLTDEQQKSIASELSPVLAMLDRLREVDTTGVPPMTHVLEFEPTWRKDEADSRWSREDALSQAEITEEGFVKTPRRG